VKACCSHRFGLGRIAGEIVTTISENRKIDLLHWQANSLW
jgi:hypothetical protein